MQYINDIARWLFQCDQMSINSVVLGERIDAEFVHITESILKINFFLPKM